MRHIQRLYSLLSVPSFREQAKSAGLEANLRSIHAQAPEKRMDPRPTRRP